MEILLSVMILIIKQGHIQAAAVFLSCPTNVLNSSVDNLITGWFDSSVLANNPCAFPVEKNEFLLRKGSVDTKICDQNFSTSTVICNNNYNAQNCKCDNNFGTNYSYTLKFVADSAFNAGDIILRSDCVDSSLQYIYQSQPCSIRFATTPPPVTTTHIQITTDPIKEDGDGTSNDTIYAAVFGTIGVVTVGGAVVGGVAYKKKIGPFSGKPEENTQSTSVETNVPGEEAKIPH